MQKKSFTDRLKSIFTKKEKNNKSTRWKHFLGKLLFWLSQISLLFIMGAFSFFVMSDLFIDSQNWFHKFQISLPFFVVLISIILCFWGIKKEDRLKLFFLVEIPLLLILFGQLFTNVYPSSVVVLVFVAIISIFMVLFDLIWGEKLQDKTSRLSKALNPKIRGFLINYQPIFYTLGFVFSIWLFLIWFFWVPGIMYQIIAAIIENFSVSYIADFVFAISESVFVLPFVITIFYWSLSPAFIFFGFFREILTQQIPQKIMVISTCFIIMIGSVWGLDFFEKTAPRIDLLEAKSALNIEETSDNIKFNLADLAKITNENRLKESLLKIYTIQLKYPLHKEGRWAPLDDLENSIQNLYGKEERHPNLVKYLNNFYKILLFPFIYEHDAAEDRDMAKLLYKYIFDGDIIEENSAEILAMKNKSALEEDLWSRSWANSEASSIDRFQKLVHLEKIRYEIKLDKKSQIYTNKVDFELRNTTDDLQEVYFEFELPSKTAVITDLKLGLDLEFQGKVAPRGLARSIYRESLKHRVDPALIEQSGPRQYRLRVYPILGKNNGRTHGLQRVQFTFTDTVSAEKSTDNTMDLPGKKLKIPINFKQTTRNILIDQKTEIINYVGYLRWGSDSAFLSAKDILSNNIKHVTTEYFSSPDPEDLEIPDLFNFKNKKLEDLKHKIFFLDISKSAENQLISDIYQEIKTLKNTEVYTYNFEVKKLKSTQELKNKQQSTSPSIRENERESLKSTKKITFWGPSNTDNLLTFLSEDLETDKLGNAQIFIVTDDSDFELNINENKTINLAKFGSIPVNILSVKGKLKAQDNQQYIFKNGLANLVIASGGDSYTLKSLFDFKNLKTQKLIWYIDENNIEMTKDNTVSLNHEKYAELSSFSRKNLVKIFAKINANEKLKEITNEETWYEKAREQFEISKKHGILTPFASYIAVEETWQKEALKNKEKDKDAFDSDHDTALTNDGQLFGQSGSEPLIWILLVSLFIMHKIVTKFYNLTK